MQAVVYIDTIEQKLAEYLPHVHCQPLVCVGWTGQDATHNTLDIGQHLGEASDRVPLVKWVNDEQLTPDMDILILSMEIRFVEKKKILSQRCTRQAMQ